MDLSLETARELLEFDCLLGAAWFRRVWPFQEAMVSELSYMRFGECVVSYPEFFKACLASDYFESQDNVTGNSSMMKLKSEVAGPASEIAPEQSTQAEEISHDPSAEHSFRATHNDIANLAGPGEAQRDQGAAFMLGLLEHGSWRMGK